MLPKNANGLREQAGWAKHNRQSYRSSSLSRSQCIDRDALPPARTFYEGDGFSIARPSRNGWAAAKGQPPCHTSHSGKSFSVNLNHGGFCCFGCGAKGDLIAYVRLRDGCDFKAACQTLGIWRQGISADERVEITRREQEREWHRQRETDRKESERRKRIALADELRTTVRLYRNVDAELQQLGPGADDQWSALSPLLDDWRVTESDYCRAARLDNPYE